jgi:hypothetical protein
MKLIIIPIVLCLILAILFDAVTIVSVILSQIEALIQALSV